MTTTTEATAAAQPKMRGRVKGDDRQVISNYIDAGLYKELHRISVESRISKAKLLDKALELLIEYYKNNDGAIKYNK